MHCARSQNDGITVLERNLLMKKVRYAAGVLGAFGAVPALGLMTPAAAAATTQPAANIGKTVALLSGNATHCNARNAHSSANRIRGYIAYSRDNGCIGSVVGHYYGGTPTGYYMRARFYDNGLVSTRYVSGVINHGNNSITFRSSPYLMHIQKVCEVIVNSNHTPETGAVCESTGY